MRHRESYELPLTAAEEKKLIERARKTKTPVANSGDSVFTLERSTNRKAERERWRLKVS